MLGVSSIEQDESFRQVPMMTYTQPGMGITTIEVLG